MATTPSSEIMEGPVLSFLNKRLRAYRKKLNRIAQMEEGLGLGKTLNKEQMEMLGSKPAIVAAVEELEKLRPALSSAVTEEVALAVKECQDQPIAEKETLEDLLNLIYFGATFNLKEQNEFTSMMLTRQHERQSCISYDTVLDGEGDMDMLCESDLDLVAKLGKLLISRPVDSSFSHKDSLQQCVQHAKQWLAKSDQPIDSDSNITYAELRAKLNKIIASGYFTATPQIKATVDIAAATSENYTYQVPVETTVVPSEVEGSTVQFQEMGEESAVVQENGTYDGQSSYVEETPKVEYQWDDLATRDLVRNHSENSPEEDQNAGDLELKGQYNNGPRRSYNNLRGGRGGSRRGYPNGRGARGSSRGGAPYFPNGRSQYYENGNFYPRSYYNKKGRGGGGGGGVGNANNDHGLGPQTSHAVVES